MGVSTLGQLGRYQLVGVLGVGGMGTVYLGRTPGGRPVAVKAVHPSLASSVDFRSRFRREVALARRVGGPFTAAVLDADPEHDPPWLATEYIHGQSLAQVLTQHGALPERTVRALAAGLAEALEVIHAAGIIHRDLKPSNVLLSETGPRVIDFGIAKAVEGIDLTGDGPLLGTPGYMSPEHLAGLPLAPSSDVFSLGTVLAHAATGMPPFGAGQSFAVANRVSTAPPDLRQLPPALATLIRPCLAKDPAQRPSVEAILAQVGPFTVQAGWLPSEIRHAVGTRPMPTAPYPGGQPFPSAPPEAAPMGFVAYLADRFARRPVTALIGPAQARPPIALTPVAQPPVARTPVPRTPVGVVGSPPAAANLRAPRQLPWPRLQCPPLRTTAGRAAWGGWLFLLTVAGLFDAIAQSPATRSFLGGLPAAPPWLAGAFGTSADLRRSTHWVPDPVTNWVTEATSPDTIASRLAIVPIALLCCAVAIRRLPGVTEYPGQWSWSLAGKTTLGWVGTVVAVLLVCRYLHTGFASLLWAVAAFGGWTLLALPALALLVGRATRIRR